MKATKAKIKKLAQIKHMVQAIVIRGTLPRTDVDNETQRAEAILLERLRHAELSNEDLSMFLATLSYYVMDFPKSESILRKLLPEFFAITRPGHEYMPLIDEFILSKS